jgi:hypothetical protein
MTRQIRIETAVLREEKDVQKQLDWGGLIFKNQPDRQPDLIIKKSPSRMNKSLVAPGVGLM